MIYSYRMTDHQFERFLEEFRELKHEVSRELKGIKEEIERLRRD